MERELTHEQRITRVICDHLGVTEQEVTPTARLIDDLGADSLDIVELVMAFEEEFKVEIADEDGDALVTVADAAALIDRLTAAAAAPAA